MASIRSCSVTMPCTSPYSSMTNAMCTSDNRKLSSSSMPVMVSGTYSAVCSGWSARPWVLSRSVRDSHWRALITPTRFAMPPLTTGNRAWSEVSMRRRFSSRDSSRSRHTTSPRGTISEPICRSSSRNTLRTMVCSCDSITPAVVPSTSMAWISSSVTGLPLVSFTPIRRSKVRVEVDSSSTNGLVATARKLMGRATSRAKVSGYDCPMRLGTSSPTTMEK
ncbi:hypothetical protein D3C71_1537850 [compost metagenome]